MTGRAEAGREATIRFSLNGATSDEGELLFKALQEVAGNRRGAELLRQIAMRGWMDIVHNTHPRERVMLLRSMGISQSIISSVEQQFPRPLIYAPQALEPSLQLGTSQSVAQAPATTPHAGRGPVALRTGIDEPPMATTTEPDEARAQEKPVSAPKRPSRLGHSSGLLA